MPLTLSEVGFSYPGGQDVLVDINVRFGDGEVVAVTGPSGSGKTTLLHLIGGLLTPTMGMIEGQVCPVEVRWVFQTPTVLTRRSVLDNVLLGIHQQRLDGQDASVEVRRAITEVGLGSKEDRIAGTLSGGEMQRTQIARTLVGSPPLVLADEPTGQLDRDNTELVADALLRVRRPGSIVIVATHDRVVAERCDRALELRHGRVLEVSG